MKRISIPTNEIVVLDRQRLDPGDIAELAESIKMFGLIQPIIINQDKRLIAGGRRLEACKLLQMPCVDVAFRETFSDDELHELELEENVRRKDMTWQERALTIRTIHTIKKRNGALNGKSWGQRETGEMLGVSATQVNFALLIATELSLTPKSKVWDCATFSDALRFLVQRKQDEAYALLKEKESKLAAQRLAEQFTTAEPKAISTAKPAEDLTFERERYYSNPHNLPGTFELYWEERNRLRSEVKEITPTIPISEYLYHGDCLHYMAQYPDTFDHIVTDPPYAIDMDMLEQDNTGMVNIESVAAEHDVTSNEALLKAFFPAAFRCLKDSGFCVTWCDISQWQLMYDAAIAAGFRVQRWPIVWVKLVANNQAAGFNFTKNYELAMVCRKPSATLTKPQSSSVITAPHDDFKKLGHPFVKPKLVWDFLINAVSLPGQTILDPFAGRGSGFLSILKSGRRAYGCELRPEHFNALTEHVKQHYLALHPKVQFI